MSMQVERALADRDGAFSAQPEMPAAARLDEETSVHLEEMQEEINVSVSHIENVRTHNFGPVRYCTYVVLKIQF